MDFLLSKHGEKCLLHYAAGIYGSLDAVRFLCYKLHQHKESLDLKDSYGKTPLHYAAKHGNVRIIHELILLGSNPLAQVKSNVSLLYVSSRLAHHHDQPYAHCTRKFYILPFYPVVFHFFILSLSQIQSLSVT